MTDTITLLQEVEEDLQSRKITVIDHNRTEDRILARGKDNRAFFIYRLDTNPEAWLETDLISHVSKGYDKTFYYLLRKNGLRLISRETDDDYFDMLVSHEAYKSYKQIAKNVKETAREAEKSGQYVKIDRRLSFVLVYRGEEDEFPFQGSEADKLIKEAEQSRLHHFCSAEDILLWQAQGW